MVPAAKRKSKMELGTQYIHLATYKKSEKQFSMTNFTDLQLKTHSLKVLGIIFLKIPSGPLGIFSFLKQIGIKFDMYSTRRLKISSQRFFSLGLLACISPYQGPSSVNQSLSDTLC